ncbi:MAG TPA: hypothetical protein VFP84_09935 [Kofleriaceae bacterium]|nr:hypothetical protein [Kofleriaceae bacterium]
MRKSLSFAFAFALALGACKTENQPAASAGSNTEAPGGKARSAKIGVKPVSPEQPALPSDGAGSDDRDARREAWRERRKERMDTDGDGVVSDEERAAAIKQRMNRVRDRLDGDGDGKLTPAELAAAPGRMHFENPEALDTNHDGNIDADELAAGMKARREAVRAARAAQTNGLDDLANQINNATGAGSAAPAPAAGDH